MLFITFKLLPTLASLAGFAAAVVDRFRHPVASSFAMMGGLMPWILASPLAGALLKPLGGLPRGLFLASWPASAPLFLVAFYLFGIGAPSPQRGVSAFAAMIGVFVGGGFSFAVMCAGITMS